MKGLTTPSLLKIQNMLSSRAATPLSICSPLPGRITEVGWDITALTPRLFSCGTSKAQTLNLESFVASWFLVDFFFFFK